MSYETTLQLRGFALGVFSMVLLHLLLNYYKISNNRPDFFLDDCPTVPMESEGVSDLQLMTISVDVDGESL